MEMMIKNTISISAILFSTYLTMTEPLSSFSTAASAAEDASGASVENDGPVFLFFAAKAGAQKLRPCPGMPFPGCSVNPSLDYL